MINRMDRHPPRVASPRPSPQHARGATDAHTTSLALPFATIHARVAPIRDRDVRRVPIKMHDLINIGVNECQAEDRHCLIG